MGYAVAGHLATVGCPMRVCNGAAAKVEARVAEHGGESFAPPGEATAGAEFVLGCMFPTRGAVIRDDAFLCGLIREPGRRWCGPTAGALPRSGDARYGRQFSAGYAPKHMT